MANPIQDSSKNQETPKLPVAETTPQTPEIPAALEVEPQIETLKPQEVISTEPQEGQTAPELLVKTTPIDATTTAKSPTIEKIEDILEEDLEEIYFQLPPEKQAEFAKEGEITATKIALLLGGVKIHVKKILILITRWLQIIPGINKYFLQQESKIKTDKLLELKQKGEIPGLEDKNKI